MVGSGESLVLPSGAAAFGIGGARAASGFVASGADDREAELEGSRA